KRRGGLLPLGEPAAVGRRNATRLRAGDRRLGGSGDCIPAPHTAARTDAEPEHGPRRRCDLLGAGTSGLRRFAPGVLPAGLAAPPGRGGLRGLHRRAGTERPSAGRTAPVRNSTAVSAPGPTEPDMPRWLLVVVGILAAVAIVVAWGPRLSWGLWQDETQIVWQ